MRLSEEYENLGQRVASILSSTAFKNPEGVAGILRRRHRLILRCLLVWMVLAGLFVLVTGKRYQASASLLVIDPGAVPLEDPTSDTNRFVNGVEDEIPTHTSLITSQVILRRAVESIGLSKIPSFSGMNLDEAIRDMVERVAADRIDRHGKIIQAIYLAPTPEEAVQVLTAITDCYRAFLEEVYSSKNSEVVVLMTRARDDLGVELKELEKKYLEFRQNTPSLTSDAEGRTLMNQRIEEWEKTSRDLMVKSVRLQSQLELGRELAKEGVGLWATTFALDQLNGGVEGQGLKAIAAGPGVPNDHVGMLLAEQQKMAVQLGPQSTKVKEIQEQIESSVSESRRSRGKVEEPEVRELLTSIEKTLKSIVTMRTQVQSKFEQDMALVKSAEVDLLTDTTLKNELERQRQLYDTVLGQLKRSKIAGGYSAVGAQIVEAPNAIPKPVRPRTMLTLVLAMVAGLMTGLGASLGAELIDTRIRTAPTAARVTGLHLLGQIPFDERSLIEAGPMDGPACQTRPRSTIANAFRLIRARLDLIREARNAKVVMVTGPAGGEGKSAVAANLAVVMAQSGRRILLIDTDLKTPSLHLLFGVSRNRGLVHVLRGLMSSERVIRNTSVTNLDLLVSGPEVADPTALFETNELAECLEPLRSEYDLIIIDAPSVAESADATLIGSMVDAVVLVVGIPLSCREQTQQALVDLGVLQTPIVGLVVNTLALDFPPWTPPRSDSATQGRSDAQEIPYDPRLVVPTRENNGDIEAASHHQFSSN